MILYTFTDTLNSNTINQQKPSQPNSASPIFCRTVCNRLSLPVTTQEVVGTLSFDLSHLDLTYNRLSDFKREVHNGATLRYAAQGNYVHMGGEIVRQVVWSHSSTCLYQQSWELSLQHTGCCVELLKMGEALKLGGDVGKKRIKEQNESKQSLSRAFIFT